jgi:hypothetical protein
MVSAFLRVANQEIDNGRERLTREGGMRRPSHRQLAYRTGGYIGDGDHLI